MCKHENTVWMDEDEDPQTGDMWTSEICQDCEQGINSIKIATIKGWTHA